MHETPLFIHVHGIVETVSSDPRPAPSSDATAGRSFASVQLTLAGQRLHTTNKQT